MRLLTDRLLQAGDHVSGARHRVAHAVIAVRSQDGPKGVPTRYSGALASQPSTAEAKIFQLRDRVADLIENLKARDHGSRTPLLDHETAVHCGTPGTTIDDPPDVKRQKADRPSGIDWPGGEPDQRLQARIQQAGVQPIAASLGRDLRGQPNDRERLVTARPHLFHAGKRRSITQADRVRAAVVFLAENPSGARAHGMPHVHPWWDRSRRGAAQPPDHVENPGLIAQPRPAADSEGAVVAEREPD